MRKTTTKRYSDRQRERINAHILMLHKKHATPSVIAEVLNKERLKTPNGKPISNRWVAGRLARLESKTETKKKLPRLQIPTLRSDSTLPTDELLRFLSNSEFSLAFRKHVLNSTVRNLSS